MTLSLEEQTKDKAGITQKYFLSYFNGLKNGYAIKVKRASLYSNPVSIKSKFGITPPQSFVYV